MASGQLDLCQDFEVICAIDKAESQNVDARVLQQADVGRELEGAAPQ